MTNPEDANTRIADAMGAVVTELLDLFDVDQRAQASFDFDEGERRLWFYTPTDHGGLAMTQMDALQRQMVWRLLATGLSVAGYNTAALVVTQENILDSIEGFSVEYGFDRARDPLRYWIAVFGDPGSEGRWGWRFGGHHVSLHFTIVDGRVVSATPCFFGADPASTPLLGPHLHRPLAAVEDLGRELVRSFDEPQRSAAVLSSAAPSDLVTGNRTMLRDGDRALSLQDVWRTRFETAIDKMLGEVQASMDAALGGTPEELARLTFTTRPKGLAASDMIGGQRELMRELLLTYVGRIHDDLADAEMARVDDGFDDLHFLWAGSLEPMTPHYYRVQGCDLLVEYDNAARGGNHVHTVWRDLTTDFGGDPLAAHYLGSPRSHGHD